MISVMLCSSAAGTTGCWQAPSAVYGRDGGSNELQMPWCCPAPHQSAQWGTLLQNAQHTFRCCMQHLRLRP